MTTFKTILILLFILIFQRSIGQNNLDTITAENASLQIGQQVIVKAKVLTVFYAKNSNGKPTFLNLDKDFPNNPIAVIIFEKELKKLKIDATQYKSKTIIVKGKVEWYKDEEKPYKNKPSIIIYNNEQISIIDI
jgi:hypothetical protein